jgi:hypothetical protein
MAEDGFEISPILVLSAENLRELFASVGHNNEDGTYLNGLIVVSEYHDPQSPLGRKYVLGKLLHEAAHSTAPVDYNSVLTKLDHEDHRSITTRAGVPYGTFRKENFIKGRDRAITGDFLEEAFADLTRVRGVKRLGQEAHAIDDANGFTVRGHVRYIDPHFWPDNPVDGMTYIPLGFAGLFDVDPRDNEIKAEAISSALAAYGLDLLDKRLPGLYQQMQDARKDPRIQMQIIKRIESIQPGLYRSLRNLDYTAEDFEDGLNMIQAAIAASPKDKVLTQ